MDDRKITHIDVSPELSFKKELLTAMTRAYKTRVILQPLRSVFPNDLLERVESELVMDVCWEKS